MRADCLSRAMALSLVAVLGLVAAGCGGEETTTTDFGPPVVTPPVESVDPVTITSPNTASAVTSTKATISFSGTKPAYTGVWISHHLGGAGGQKLSESLVVARDKETTWSTIITLKLKDGEESTANYLVFKAYKADDEVSTEVAVSVQYSPIVVAPPTPDTEPLAIKTLTSEGNTFNSLSPRVAVGGDKRVYAVWQQCSGADQCNKTTVMVARLDKEYGWGTAVEVSRLSDQSAHGTLPDVAVDSAGKAHIVWRDTGTAGARTSDSDILYRTWDGTNAVGLGPISTVSVGGELTCVQGGSCPEVYDAKVTMAGDSPGVVLRADGSSRPFEIFYSTRTDGAWGAEKVSDDTGAGAALSSAVARDATGSAHVVWGADGALYYRSLGTLLGARTPVPLRCTGGVVSDPAVAVIDANVYVTWVGTRDCANVAWGLSVFYNKLPSSGAFGAAVEVTREFPLVGSNHQDPRVVLKGGSPSPEMGLTWSSDAPVGSSGTDYDILIRRYSDGQAGTVELLSEMSATPNGSTEASKEPDSVVVGDDIITCWQEQDTGASPDYDIYCRRVVW